jgi:tRNA-dihydrouridine synthase
MRKHIGWYLHGMRGAAQLRDQINHMDHPNEVKDALIRGMLSEEGDKP